jgi:hypothetical protein
MKDIQETQLEAYSAFCFLFETYYRKNISLHCINVVFSGSLRKQTSGWGIYFA